MAKLLATLELDTKPFTDSLKQTAGQTAAYSENLKKTLGETKFTVDTNEAQKSVDSVRDKMTNLKDVSPAVKIAGIAAAVVGVQELSNQLMGVISISNEFESSIAAVGAITGFTGEKLDKIGTAARTLAKDFGGSATDQLKSFQGVLSKLGPAIGEDSEALAMFGRNISTLSAASGDDATTSMNAITDAMLQMGLATGTPIEQAQKSTDVINALAAGAQVGAAEIPQVAQALVVAGVAAKGAKMDVVGVNAAIQVLAMGGKTGSEAGTALRNVLGLLQKASGPAEAAMKKLGTSSKELGQILTTQGLDVALAKVQSGMNKIGTDAEKNATLMEIFGTENSAAAGILLGNTDKFKEFSDGIRAGMEGQGSAFEQAAMRMSTTEAVISRVKARLSDLAIGFGQSVGTIGKLALTGAAQLAPLITGIAGLTTVAPAIAKLGTEMMQFGLSLIQKVIPALITTAVVTDAEGVATTKLVVQKNALTITTLKDTAAKMINAVVTAGMTVATNAATFAQWALNAAFLASPVGWVVLGIGALIGIMYLLYTNVQSVANVFDTAWGAIVAVVSGVWDVLKKVGEIMFEVGKIMVTFLIAPYLVAYKVISQVVSKIADFVKSLFGVSEAASGTSDVVKSIGSAFDWVVDKLNYFLAMAKGAMSAFTSIIDNVATGISQILTFDFSGAIDTFGNVGGNAAIAFNEGMQRELDAQSWDKSVENINSSIEEGLKLKATIDTKDSFADLIKNYETAKSSIAALKTKEASGVSLTDAEKQSLTELENKAMQTAAQIGKIAPETRDGFKTIVDGAGQLKEVYDINIDKAKTFASTTSNTAAQVAAANQFSESVATQAALIDKAKSAQYLLQVQIDQQTDPAKRKELVDKYNEEKKLIDEKGNSLQESFKKGAAAGLLTDEAIKTMAKSLNITDEQAKKMALGYALEDAGKKGAVTESKIAAIAKQFGVSEKAVKDMLEEQKKSTAEAEKTAAAALSIGDAYEESAKKAKEAVEKSEKNISGLLNERRNIEKQIRETNDAGIRAELQKKLASINEQIDAEKKAGKESFAITKKNAEDNTKAKELIEGKKEKKDSKASERAESVDFIKFQQKLNEEQAKREEETRKMNSESKIKSYENDLKKINSMTNLTESERLRLVIATELKILDAKKQNEIDAARFAEQTSLQKIQKDMLLEAGKAANNKKIAVQYQKDLVAIESDETKTQQEKYDLIQKLNDETLEKFRNNPKNEKLLESLNLYWQKNKELAEKSIESKTQSITVKYDEQSVAKKDESDKKLSEAELKEQKSLLQAKLALIDQNNKEQIEKAKALKLELLAIEYSDVLKANAGERTPEQLAKYKEYLDKKAELDKAAATATINLSKDEEFKKQQFALLSAQELYAKAVQAANGNSDAILKAEQKLLNDKYQANLEYYKNSNLYVRTSLNFIDSLNEELANNEESRDVEESKRKLANLDDERKSLNDKYKKGEMSYQEYAASLTKIDADRAEAQKDIEKSKINFLDKLQKAGTKTFDKEIDKQNAILKNKDATDEELSKARQTRAAMEFASLLLNGQLTLGKAAGIAIDFLASMLEKQIPVWTAGIFGSSVAELGPAGLAVAAGLTATMLGLAAAAKSALGAETGQLPGVKSAGRRGASDTQLTWINPNEAILPQDMTGREKDLLKFMFAGGTSYDYYKSKFSKGGLGMPNNSQTYNALRESLTPSYNIQAENSINRQLLSEISALRTEFKQGRKVDIRQNIKHEFSDFEIKSGSLVSAYKKEEKKRNRKW